MIDIIKPKKDVTNFAPVQNYINIYDSNILWYYIPGFNGYEISSTGIVRSMKHFRKYPYGMIIRPKEIKDPIELFVNNYPELTYVLSDNNNERQVVTRTELINLARNNHNKVYGYPRKTIVTDIGSRNIVLLKPPKPKSEIPLTEQIHEVQFYYKENSNIIQPLIFERTEDNV